MGIGRIPGRALSQCIHAEWSAAPAEHAAAAAEQQGPDWYSCTGAAEHAVWANGHVSSDAPAAARPGED